MEAPMGVERTIRIERDSNGQTIHIPSDLALPGELAFIRKEGNEVILRPAEEKNEHKKMANLFEWLQQQEPIDDEFPDVDEGLLPMRDVNL